MKWLWTVQADQRYCKQVHLHPRETEPDSFDEFPDDERLQSFDPSDRKYVAVALGSGLKPVVVNAVDPDWAEHFTALQETGLRIRFLCPQHVRPEN